MSEKVTIFVGMRTSADRKLIEKTYLSRKPRISSLWPAAWAIAAMMVLQIVFDQNWGGLAHWLTATPAQVFGQGQVWRLFTTLGVHADLGHFLANAGYFVGLAFLLNAYFGAWAFPVLAFVGGAAANVGALWGYDSQIELVGASGVVYFMAAFWLAQYVAIETRLTLARRLINAMAFTLVLLMPERFEPHVSYSAHAWGYALGAILGGMHALVRRGEYRAAERVRVPEPATDEVDFDLVFGPEGYERLASRETVCVACG